MPSNDLTRRIHIMLLTSEFGPEDHLFAVDDVLDRTREERQEIRDSEDHKELLNQCQDAGKAWGILGAGPDLYVFARRISQTKDPLRKDRLIARGRQMVRDLYDRRREVLDALNQHLAEEDKAMRAQWRHEPENYACPFCALVQPAAVGDGVNSHDDIVLRTDRATAFVAPKWWPNNKGHVLVVPNAHHENIYDIPAEDGHAVHDAVQEIAIAIRATYGCDGVSTRQHNEPAGYQDVWHLHVHVFPRYAGDQLYNSLPLAAFVSSQERAPYAERLRDYLTLSRTQAR